jgi:hypothetical protein
MRFLTSRLMLGLALLMLAAVSAQAREVQLAGIRLGDHAINILDVYGMPDGIAVGEGTQLTVAQTAGGAAGGASMMGQPTGGDIMGMAMGAMGMGGGMPGMMPMGGGPPGGMPGGPGMPGGMPGGPPGGMPGGEGAGAFPGGAPGAPGAAGGPGAGAGGAAAGGLAQEPFPIWALAVWVDLEARDVEWVYQKGPVVMGFVLDRDGFCKVIAVAAENCNYARTSLWQPHKYIKLGDNFKRVMYRYGYPDETITFNASGPGEVGTGGGEVSVQFGQTTRTYSRDCLLRYTQNNNVEFTLHDMVVSRIYIWE